MPVDTMVLTRHVCWANTVLDATDRIAAGVHDQHAAARHVDAERAIAIPAHAAALLMIRMRSLGMA